MPFTTVPFAPLGVIVTVMVPCPPAPTLTGVAAGADASTSASSGSPLEEVMVASNGRVCAVAVKVLVTVGLPASPNGPMLVGNASQVCGATIGSSFVTDGCVPAGPASRSGSPSNDRFTNWSAGNGEISNSVVGVRTAVHPRAKVSRSVLLGADYYDDQYGDTPLGVGPDVVLDRVIVDKNARIGAGARLINEKGLKDVDGDGYFIRSGLIVVPKNGIVKPGTVV